MYEKLKSKRKIEWCRKRVREDLSATVHKIFRKEMTEVLTRDYDSVAETPWYENSQTTTLYLEKRKASRFTQNPADSMHILF